MTLKLPILPMLLLCVAAALLNSNAFGSPSLIAYFFSNLLIGLTAIAGFSVLLFKKQPLPAVPPYIVIYLLLCGYIWIHGLLTGKTVLVHYYWIGNGLLLLLVHTWVSVWQPLRGLSLLYKGIVALMLVESIVVAAQFTGLFPVPNPYFLCTGTWGNPNVTAIFLAMGLYPLLLLKKQAVTRLSKWIYKPLLALVLLAIIVLQCRSAWMAALVFLVYTYAVPTRQYLANMAGNARRIAVVVAAIIIFVLALSLFQFKKASAESRLRVWAGSIQLITQRPLTGYGFGSFEKYYNTYAAAQQYPVNDHVNTAYNDWLEMGVEGGLIAVVLWAGFVYLLARNWWPLRKKSPESAAVLPAFLLIQLTNFGIQAIPANLLFLLYAGISAGQVPVRQIKPLFARAYCFAVLGVAIGLLLRVSLLTGTFYNHWMMASNQTHADKRLAAYGKQENILTSYASYHDAIGDAFVQQRAYRSATNAYCAALRHCTRPDILSKCGLCYQQLGMYDSSHYYYTLLRDMQPQRVAPRMALLQLYALRRDTPALRQQAVEIAAMPVKVRSREAAQMKQYAQRLIDSLLQQTAVKKEMHY